MKPQRPWRQLLDEVAQRAETNPAVAERLATALAWVMDQRRPKPGTRHDKLPGASSRATGVRRGRRAPGVLDPFDAAAEGEQALRQALAGLDVEQLKDIVAEQGMDPANLALKWKRNDRLVDLIVTTVNQRSRKGEAFRGAQNPESPMSGSTPTFR